MPGIRILRIWYTIRQSMKKNISCVLLWALAVPVMSQSEEAWFNAFQDSVRQIQTLRYTATYRFKGFGSDDFDTRQFEVFARRNPGRNAYGFDWEIVQHDEVGESRFVLTGSTFFNIVKSFQRIGYKEGVARFPEGDYLEFLRMTALWDELLFDFDSLYAASDVEMRPSQGGTELKIRINEHQDRILFFPKNACLPNNVINIVRNEELGLEQIMETSLSQVETNAVLPDSVLRPQYYLNQGYEIILKKQKEKKQEQPALKDSLLLHLIFNTPMLEATGDTVTLREMETARLLVLDFWYISCAPCMKAMPKMQELADKYRDKGVRVVGINSFDWAEKASIAQKLREKGIDFTTLYSDRSLVDRLGFNAFPRYLIIGHDHRILFSGFATSTDLETVLLELLEH